MALMRGEFLGLLSCDPCGRAWLIMAQYGVLNGQCTPEQVHAILDKAFLRLQTSASAGYKETPSLAWKSTQLEVLKTELDATTDGVTPATHEVPGPFSHITTYAAMELYHFNGLPEAMSETVAWRPQTDGSERHAIVQGLLDTMRQVGNLTPKSSARLGGDRLWISTDWASQVQLSEGEDVAARLRDAYGLVHCTARNFLMAYALSDECVPPSRRPSALDGVGVRFRPWSNSGFGTASWGCAVDLHKFAAGEPNIDGVFEGLLPAVRITSDVIVAIQALGCPGARGGVLERGGQAGVDDDTAFAERLESEGASLGVRIQDLLSGGSNDAPENPA